MTSSGHSYPRWHVFKNTGLKITKTSKKDSSARFTLSVGFTAFFPQQLPSHRFPAFCRLCRHLPDLVRHGELVLVPHSCRSNLDRIRRFSQSILQSGQSIMLIFSCLSLASAGTEHKFLELAFFDLRSRDPARPASHSLLLQSRRAETQTSAGNRCEIQEATSCTKSDARTRKVTRQKQLSTKKGVHRRSAWGLGDD